MSINSNYIVTIKWQEGDELKERKANNEEYYFVFKALSDVQEFTKSVNDNKDKKTVINEKSIFKEGASFSQDLEEDEKLKVQSIREQFFENNDEIENFTIEIETPKVNAPLEQGEGEALLKVLEDIDNSLQNQITENKQIDNVLTFLSSKKFVNDKFLANEWLTCLKGTSLSVNEAKSLMELLAAYTFNVALFQEKTKEIYEETDVYKKRALTSELRNLASRKQSILIELNQQIKKLGGDKKIKELSTAIKSFFENISRKPDQISDKLDKKSELLEFAKTRSDANKLENIWNGLTQYMKEFYSDHDFYIPFEKNAVNRMIIEPISTNKESIKLLILNKIYLDELNTFNKWYNEFNTAIHPITLAYNRYLKDPENIFLQQNLRDTYDRYNKKIEKLATQFPDHKIAIYKKIAGTNGKEIFDKISENKDHIGKIKSLMNLKMSWEKGHLLPLFDKHSALAGEIKKNEGFQDLKPLSDHFDKIQTNLSNLIKLQRRFEASPSRHVQLQLQNELDKRNKNLLNLKKEYNEKFKSKVEELQKLIDGIDIKGNKIDVKKAFQDKIDFIDFLTK